MMACYRKGDAVCYRNNCYVVILLKAVICSCYAVTLPSMYQFVTTPSTLPKEAENDTFRPGLGESDYMYSWVVAVYSIGEFIGTLGSIYVTMTWPFCYSIPLACLMVSGGGALYALSTNVWMILTARILFGVSAGLGFVLVYTYIGIFSNQSKNCDKERLRTKDKLFLASFVIYYLTFTSCLGVVTLVTHVIDVDLYRWGGWYALSVSLLYLVLFLIFYKEMNTYKPKLLKITLPSSARRTRPLWYKRNCCTYLKYGGTLVFIMYYSYTRSTVYTVLDTISTPVLSDQFGIGVTSAPYFMLGIITCLTVIVSALSILKRLGVDNRVGLALSLVLAICGAVLVGDWQSFQGNPCAMNTTYMSSVEPELSGKVADNSGTGPLPEVSSTSGCCEHQLMTVSDSFPTDAFTADNNASKTQSRELCESQSTSEHLCFWNPDSRVTGEHCAACKPVCLSAQTSLNFVQFTIGVALTTSLIPLGSYFGVVVASNFAGKKFQSPVQSFVYLAGVIARITSPLWVVAVYEKSGEHTYAPASLLAVNMLLLLLLLPVFYKWLAPGSTGRLPLYKASIYPTPDTHKMDRQEEPQGFLSLDSINKWADSAGLSTTSFIQTPTKSASNSDISYDTSLNSSPGPVTFTVGE